jgi:hypothetical protein
MALTVVMTEVVDSARLIVVRDGQAITVRDGVERELVMPDGVVRIRWIGKTLRHPTLSRLFSGNNFANAEIDTSPCDGS